MFNRLRPLYIAIISLSMACTDGIDLKVIESDSLGLSPKVLIPMAKSTSYVDSVVKQLGEGEKGFSVLKGPNGELSIRRSLDLPLNQLDFGSFLNSQGIEEFSVDLSDQPFKVSVREVLPFKKQDGSDVMALYEPSSNPDNYVAFNSALGGIPDGFAPSPTRLATQNLATQLTNQLRHNLNIPYSAYANIEATIEQANPNTITLRASNASQVKIKELVVELFATNSYANSVGEFKLKDLGTPSNSVTEVAVTYGGNSRQVRYNSNEADFKSTSIVIPSNFTFTGQIFYRITRLEFEAVGAESIVNNPVRSMPEQGVSGEDGLYLEFIYDFQSSEKQITVRPSTDPSAPSKNALHPVDGQSRLYEKALTNVTTDKNVQEKTTYYAVVKSGIMTVNLEYVGNPDNEVGVVDLTFNDFVSPEQKKLTMRFEKVASSKGKLTLSKDISGYALDFRGENKGALGDKVRFFVSYDNLQNKQGNNLNLSKGNERLEISLSFQDVSTSQLTGTFTGSVFPAKFDEISLGNLSKDERYQKHVKFITPSIELDYKNTLGVPSRISSKIYAFGKDESKNPVRLDSAFISQQALGFNPNKQLDDIIKIEVSPLFESKVGYEDEIKILNSIPDRLSGIFELTVDPPGSGESSVVTFTDETKLDMSLNIDLPLIVQIDKLMYKDTLLLNGKDFTISKDARPVANEAGVLEYGYIIVEAVNNLPLDMTAMKVKLYDKANNELTSSLFPTEKRDNSKPQVYPRCVIGTSQCQTPTKTRGYIAITEPVAEALEKSSYTIVEIEVSSKNNTDLQVQIFSEDYIQIGYDLEINDPEL